MALEINKTTARTIPASQLLENIDDWTDFLIEHREEANYDKTLGFIELTVRFPEFPWVPGVAVHADPWEHEKVWAEYEGDEHAYILNKAKEQLKDQEIKRLRNVATGPLTPIDWLHYADGEPGSKA